MRALVLVLASMALSASALAQPAGDTLNVALDRARAEQAAAEKEAAQLEKAAGKARNEADRLRAEEQAAAQAIDAAEARITAANAQLRLADAYVVAHRTRLAREQQPVSALLAGLAVMAQRPPLLALADRGSTDELVEVRILLASTLPVIRARTSKLSAQLAEGQRLQQSARAARAELAQSRGALVSKRARFAELEQRAQKLALGRSGQALSAGDVAIAVGEDVEQLSGAEANSQAIRSVAQQLASAGPAPPRPVAGEGRQVRAPFAYALPAAAPVTEGLGTVSASGVRSRGLTLATARGLPVTAPASGIVRFAGPFREYDGVVIIDHGGGWMSLIVNLSAAVRKGDQVRLGDPIGRSLGPIQVELSQNGRRISPALIAGSSLPLSNGSKGG
ncbi:MAG: peptidoglycan DD-metalloendopeptidase family protein [Pseudomonadota bacterium]